MEEPSEDVQEQESITKDKSQHHYNLRNQVQNIEIEEDIEDSEIPMNLILILKILKAQV